MENNRKTYLILLVSLALFLTGSVLYSATVYMYPDSGAELITRYGQVKKDLAKKPVPNGYWLGYSIKKQMGRNTFYGSYGNFSFTTTGSYHVRSRSRVLGFILFGKDFLAEFDHQQNLKKMAGQILDQLEYKNQPKVVKDIAILFRFDSRTARIPAEVRYSNLTLEFSPGSRPIFWLGQAGDEESFLFITRFFYDMNNDKIKRQSLSAVGLHSTASLAVPFLSKVLRSAESEKVRGRAAGELGEFPTRESFNLLFETAKTNRSDYIRKQALYGLEDLDMPEAVDAIIYLARSARDIETRKRAISVLGDIAGKKARAALKDVVYSDDDTDIKKRAVYAFEDLPNGEGIPYLIEIARNHPNLKVRKSAIYCLGDSKDPRALKTLIEIIKEK